MYTTQSHAIETPKAKKNSSASRQESMKEMPIYLYYGTIPSFQMNTP